MSLKDQLAKDLDIFINQDEFADYHNIDGEQVLCVIDEDNLGPIKNSADYPGVFQSIITVSCKLEDLGYRPVVDQVMSIDNRDYHVLSCAESAGMLEIKLEANLS